jgi:hemoglobin
MLVIGLIIIAIIAIIYIVYAHLIPKQPSLYDRLGGVFAIALVVNHFSDAIVENHLIGKNSPNAFLRDWHRNKLDRLPGLKFLRTLWLCAVSGGPYKYQGTKPGKCPFSLENAHSNLHITSQEFDEAASILSDSLMHFNVPAKESQEVLAAFAAHKSEVIGV